MTVKQRKEAMSRKHVRIVGMMVAGILTVFVSAGWIALSMMQKEAEAQAKAAEMSMKAQQQQQSDDYDDSCGIDDDCSTCKRDLKCLSCMHGCYNRWGNDEDRANPWRSKAVVCLGFCYDPPDEEVPGSKRH